jgi:flagellar motor switch protein FliN/FliY
MSTIVGVEPAIAEALAAAAAAFPIAELQTEPARIVESAGDAHPEGGGRWAAAPFTGDRPGIVAVIVSFDVASGLFNTSGKAPKLAAPIKAAVKALGGELGEVTTGRTTDALPPIEGCPADAARSTNVMHLLSAGEHVVTVVVVQSEAAAVTAAESDHDVDPDAEAASFPLVAGAASPVVRSALQTADARALSVIRSVEMNVTAELGRSSMTVRELLELGPGSVIELDRAAGSPVDLLVNGTIIARGEVVVIDEEYGIRVSEIIGSPDDL